MAQKILVALDDSENAMRAVEFVANNLSPDNQITLFSVLLDTAAVCEMQSPELIPYFLSKRDAFCSIEDKMKALVEEAVQKAKETLTGAGFVEQNITIKMETKKGSIAGDIVNEANSGYDIIVLGRRGLSGIKDFFFGSVTQKVLNSAKDVSVLLVN